MNCFLCFSQQGSYSDRCTDLILCTCQAIFGARQDTLAETSAFLIGTLLASFKDVAGGAKRDV